MAVARAKGKLRGRQANPSPKQQAELRQPHPTSEYTITDLTELWTALGSADRELRHPDGMGEDAELDQAFQRGASAFDFHDTTSCPAGRTRESHWKKNQIATAVRAMPLRRGTLTFPNRLQARSSRAVSGSSGR